MKCSASVALALIPLIGCSTEPVDTSSATRASAIKSQLRGYDLGPPFPAGFRDSGLINGYDEGEWVPFVAKIEGRKLVESDGLAGSTSDGVYGASIIFPTYSDKRGANGISDVLFEGVYGQGAVTPIPDGFDDGWLVANGYSPFVLGAYDDAGGADAAPRVVGIGQRVGPTRFGGSVASASVAVEFDAAAGAELVELRFAVRLAPAGLAPIRPADQDFPGTDAGDALGAADFHPGPGPIFVGYEVGKPTGIATVPIRVERNRCDDSDDCVPGDVCGPGNECVDPCATDAECPTGELCEDGVCQPPPPPCEDDDDCEEDVCVGGFCIPECPETCPDPELCDPDPCLPPGGDNPPCVIDVQCPGGQLCEDGVCVPPSPPCDVSCPEGDTCIGGECVPPGDPCAGDGDCPGGSVCIDGFCEPGSPPCIGCEVCTDDGDCPGGTTCTDGVCVPVGPPLPCADDAECPGDETCEAGFCTPPPDPCGPSGECRPGELCEEGPDVCVPEHPPITCDDATDCPAGDICFGGVCTPDDPGGPGAPCKNKPQCDDGLNCEGGFCTPPTPPACTDTAECAPGTYCEGGVCLPPHPPVPCSTAVDCPTGDECIGGYCEPPRGCEFDYQCPGGELCEDGTCRPGQPPVPCTVDTDCPPTDDDVWVPVCYDGFCVPGGGDCAGDPDCPGGAVCEDGTCLDADPPTPCTSQYDCGGGAVCEGGFCEPTDSPTGACETADDCPRNPEDDVGPACVGGLCTSNRTSLPSCAASADCAAGTLCSGGVCLPAAGACELDGDCDGGTCVSGWCGQACAAADECAAGDACVLGRCGAGCQTYADCGDMQACLGGGCVAIPAVIRAGLGGGQSAWEPELPGASPVGGGCSATGDARADLLVAVLLALGLLATRRRSRAALMALCLVACGGDRADVASDDDEADAAAAWPVADAGPVSDSAPPADADYSSSPYLLVTCGGEPSGGVGEADAGLGDAVDAPCCQPDGPCPEDLACIQDGVDTETRRCRPRCDLAIDHCPEGGVCASFNGTGVCIPASLEGAPCAPELCDAATICVGTSADDATCHRRCETSDECDDGQSCTALNGTSAKACL